MKSLGSSKWLLLSINIFNLTQFILCGTNNGPGETFPSSLEIEINSRANITCRMNPSKFGGNVNSSSLYFEQEDTKYVVPKENIHIINETTIVYMIENATEQDSYYICKIGTKGIGITHVTVGTAPLDITDFKCRGYDYTYMVCNFTKPHNLLPTQYNLSYTAQSQNYIQLCHLEIQQNQGICNLTLDKNNYRMNYEFYNFSLKGQNEVGVNVQSFWINHYESVIPPKPNYNCTNITNQTVVLKWYNPKYSFYAAKGLEYEIRLKPRGSHWVYLSNYEIRNNRSEYKLIVRNLPFAYYWYEISVRWRVKKSARYDDSYWSEPHIQEFQTLACPPDMAPLTEVGSFYIDSSETKVRLYWRQLPNYKQNGPDFKYIIKQVKRDDIEVSLKPLNIDLTSATFPWHKRHNYTFIIKSQNQEGESPNNSTIFVPAWTKHAHERSCSPQWIRNVYHASNRTSTLSWSPPHNQKHLQDYTVFWCQSKQAIATECEDTILFKHVGKESTMFYTNPQKPDQIFNLAVSANYRDFNTGMHWTMCSADVNSELVKLDPEIADIKNRSISVQWSTDSVCSSLVEGFSLIYCQVERKLTNHANKEDCLEDPIKLTIPNTAKKYNLKNLLPYSSYKIQMNMFSKLASGNLSDAQIINTLEDAPSKPYNLRDSNVTSNSVILTWSQPDYHNGLLRKYRIAYNNEHHTVNCLTDKETCGPKQMKYKLENLSSYTIYKIYIIAHTTADSEHSNDITIQTLEGIPSNPRNVKTKDNEQNILQWSRPEVPSGRVEFYEVAITQWYKDHIEKQHISVIDGNECEFHLPICIDADYRFTKEVRAVNVVDRDSEIDHFIFASKNLTQHDLTEYFVENSDLNCVGKTLTAEKQLQIHEYQDTQKYVQYKSVWEKGPVTNCADPKLSRITMLALLIVVSSLGVMAAFYVARNKYQKMANISCALPPGLEAMAYPIKDNGSEGGGDFRRSKDSFFNNESRRLLASISQDSGYNCHNGEHNNGGLTGGLAASSSLGKSSGYMGSNQSAEYCPQDTLLASDNISDDSCVIDQTPVVDDAYMVMELLKPHASTTTSSTDNNTATGYIQPNFSDLRQLKNAVTPPSTAFMPTENGYIKQITSQLLPTENGYIKPNNLLNWKPLDKITPQTVAHTTPIPNTLTSIPINSSGYVAPQMLQKSLAPTTDGYTSLEALGKSLKALETTTSPTFITPVDAGGGGGIGNLPPISGYVTQKELSAFGLQQKFN